MTYRSRVLVRVIFLLFTLFLATTSSAQVKVLISGGFRAAYGDLLPDFEQSSGITVTTAAGPSQGNSPDAIGAQLRRGVSADVVIMSKEGLSDLLADGSVVPGTAIDLAQTLLGVAVHAGAPKPDISTVDKFKQTLLRATSVAIPSSTAGVHVTTSLFPRLGIADAMAKKIPTGGVATVVSGQADPAIQLVSEIVRVPGVDFVGTIPTDLQYVSVFSAAVVAGTKEREASRRLIAFLTSERATSAIEKHGMSRPRR